MEEHLNLIESYRKRAKDEIEAANLLFGSHLYAASVSRAYYGCFYMITSLLLGDGVETKTHKQLAIEFRKRYIKTGMLDKKYSLILDQLFNTRMMSDYDATINLEPAQVSHLIKLAEEFVSEILKI